MRRFGGMVIVLFGVTGCTLGAPFQGPSYDPQAGLELAEDTPVLIAVTEAQFGVNVLQRFEFWRQVRLVEEELVTRDGFLGHAKRMQPFGNKAWTVSVWRDENAMRDFVQSDVHQTAIVEAYADLSGARFARVTLPAGEVPLSWARVESLLDEQGRSY